MFRGLGNTVVDCLQELNIPDRKKEKRQGFKTGLGNVLIDNTKCFGHGAQHTGFDGDRNSKLSVALAMVARWRALLGYVDVRVVSRVGVILLWIGLQTLNNSGQRDIYFSTLLFLDSVGKSKNEIHYEIAFPVMLYTAIVSPGHGDGFAGS